MEMEGVGLVMVGARGMANWEVEISKRRVVDCAVDGQGGVADCRGDGGCGENEGRLGKGGGGTWSSGDGDGCGEGVKGW